ncbi:UNVERIFIED_CONTAM: hypothetical protein PYX00_007662 [Menopon gallinae]|uniref:Uncharacterized protein n=1 Tax=Menopon gallinae TaxID=328185 RepID=A0AAW2HJR1_9NEOP
MRVDKREQPSLRRPIPQQLHGGDLRVAVHGRQEGQERTVSGHGLHQNGRGIPERYKNNCSRMCLGQR